MEIVTTALANIKKYRRAYLNALPEFQELFIELMVHDSDCFMLRSDAEEMGYAIRSHDGILIEFYVLEKYIPESNEVFRQVLKELSIRAIYCKSFDFLLLSNCLINTLPYSLDGVLYRDYVGTPLTKDTAIKMEKAGLSSVSFLLEQDESIRELFETEQQLVGFIQNEYVFKFFKSGEFIGCGMVLLTHPDWDFCDLGVWVHPSKRGNAMGAQIILNLREFAIQNNLKPSCGCAIENIASQKTIEKSGFVSKHKLINFDVK